MADLTAIILTKNEEVNISDCIESIQTLASRIIVIDSFSNDNTVQLAKSHGAEVYQHEFINYAKQFKYGLENFNIKSRWVLRLDADERISKKAGEEIERLCNKNSNTDVNGLIIRFEQTFLGKKLRHGGMYPFKKLLVFKYGIGDIEDRNMDEHIILKEGKTIEVKYDCQHFDDKGLTFFVDKHNWYSSREVVDFFENNSSLRDIENEARFKRFLKYKIYYRLPIGTRAHLYYIYRYYIKLGFLDGKEGKIYAFMQAYWYRYLVDAKIFENKKMSEAKDV